MASILWSILGVLAGAFIAIQATVNAEVSRGLGMPIAAAASSFFVGAVVLSAISLALIQINGTTLNWRVPAPWMFVVGGCLGAAYVTSVILLTPRLGAAATMAFVVAGQLIAGMLIDKIGFLGVAVRELSLGRISGAVLLLVGALLIRLT